jgi:hypothetical protein
LGGSGSGLPGSFRFVFYIYIIFFILCILRPKMLYIIYHVYARFIFVYVFYTYILAIWYSDSKENVVPSFPGAKLYCTAKGRMAWSFDQALRPAQGIEAEIPQTPHPKRCLRHSGDTFLGGGSRN